MTRWSRGGNWGEQIGVDKDDDWGPHSNVPKRTPVGLDYRNVDRAGAVRA